MTLGRNGAALLFGLARRSRGAVLCAAFLVLCACGDDAPAAAAGRGRGPHGAGAGAVATAEVSPTPPAAPVGATSRSRRSTSAAHAPTPPRVGAGPGTAVAPAAPREGERDDEPAEAERDLSADLHAAIGAIEHCIDLETARRLDGALHVSVTAQLMPSGRISRASANAAGLSRAQNACIEGVVERASIRGPVEGAPRAVSTIIELNVEITEPEEAEPAPFVWGTVHKAG